MLDRREDALGERVVQLAVYMVRRRFGSDVVSGFAIGSLAHGGFVSAVSDVDVAFVFRDDARASGSESGLASGPVSGPVSASAMAEVKEDVRRRCAGTELAPLADRLSLFWDTWEALEHNRESGRFPAIDRCDLLESGRLLFGVDRRDACARPGTLDLVECGAAFFVTRFADPAYVDTLRDAGRLVASGRRALAKAVLFPARVLYTLDKGGLCGNESAAEWYAAAGRPGAELVTACLEWRVRGIGSAAGARALVEAHIVDLYAFAATEQARVLAGLGRDEASRRLRHFASVLRPTVGA